MDSDAERRLLWRKIGQREKQRRNNIEEIKKIIHSGDPTGKKNAKTLLRLVLHGEGIKSSEASKMIGVGRNVIDQWARLLEDKGLIVVDAHGHPDPKLMPSQEILNKLNKYKQEKLNLTLGEEILSYESALEKKKEELTKEHEEKIKLGEDLEKIKLQLAEKEEELKKEHRERLDLEKRMVEIEGDAAGEYDEKLRMLREQLNRERTERMKFETLMKEEHDKLLAAEEEKRRACAKMEEELMKREAEILDREKSLEEYEELDAIFGDDVEDKRISDAKKSIDTIRERIGKVGEKIAGVDDELGQDIRSIFSDEEDLARILGEELALLKRRMADLESAGKGLKADGSGKPPDEKPPAPPTPPKPPEPAFGLDATATALSDRTPESVVPKTGKLKPPAPPTPPTPPGPPEPVDEGKAVAELKTEAVAEKRETIKPTATPAAAKPDAPTPRQTTPPSQTTPSTAASEPTAAPPAKTKVTPQSPAPTQEKTTIQKPPVITRTHTTAQTHPTTTPAGQVTAPTTQARTPITPPTSPTPTQEKPTTSQPSHINQKTPAEQGTPDEEPSGKQAEGKTPATQAGPPEPPGKPGGKEEAQAKPEKRIASMEEMRKALEEPEEEGGIVLKPPRPPSNEEEHPHEIPLPPETEEKMMEDEEPVRRIASIEEMRKIFIDDKEDEKAKEEEKKLGVDIENLIELLENKKIIKINDASKAIGVNDNTIRIWANRLQEKGVVTVKKHLMREDEILLNPYVNTKEIIEAHEAERIREEIKKLHKEQ
ncbi:MAG: hypothetical protein ABIH11_00880 [Candidatus Altiarchaeota archaeon]